MYHIKVENWQNSNGVTIRAEHEYGGGVVIWSLDGNQARELGSKLLEWSDALNRHAVNPYLDRADRKMLAQMGV